MFENTVYKDTIAIKFKQASRRRLIPWFSPPTLVNLQLALHFAMDLNVKQNYEIFRLKKKKQKTISGTEGKDFLDMKSNA